MLERRARIEGQKHVGLSLWKRLILIASILLPGGSLATLIPGQTAYAQVGWSRPPFVCDAGHGGDGGIANHGSGGANGTAGGDCTNGPRGGDGAAGGQNNSFGGPGGNIL